MFGLVIGEALQLLVFLFEFLLQLFNLGSELSFKTFKLVLQGFDRKFESANLLVLVLDHEERFVVLQFQIAD